LFLLKGCQRRGARSRRRLVGPRNDVVEQRAEGDIERLHRAGSLKVEVNAI